MATIAKTSSLQIVQSLDQLEAIVTAHVEDKVAWGFDSETRGTKLERPNTLVGVAIWSRLGRFYAPLNHHEELKYRTASHLSWTLAVEYWKREREAGVPLHDREYKEKPKKPRLLTYEEQVEGLERWEGNLDERKALRLLLRLFTESEAAKFGHNIAYDLRGLNEGWARHGLTKDVLLPRGVHCSLLMTYALSLHLKQQYGGLDLDTVARKVIGERKRFDRLDTWFEERGVKAAGAKWNSLWCANVDLVGEYCAWDAALPPRICAKLWPLLKADEGCMRVYRRELALVETTISMEMAPKWVDLEYLRTTQEKGREVLRGLEADVFAASGYEFNVGSPDQLAKALLAAKIRLPYTDACQEELEAGRRPKKMAYATGAEVLEQRRGHPLVDAVLRYRALSKRVETDMGQVLEHANPDGSLHHHIVATTARTGRYCIAKGTPIEVLRDVARYPKGKPIEDVIAGDWAYTFDADRRLTLRRVLWAGKTGSRRKVIRVHWLGEGRHRRGFVDVTPKHAFRLYSGEYREAKDLRPLDRVLAVSRGPAPGGYERVWASLLGKEIPQEHRWAYAELNGGVDPKKHVHHINHNKKDNRPDNLEEVSPAEHGARHPLSPARREAAGHHMRRIRAEGRVPPPPKGPANPNWKTLDREWLIEELWKYGGHPSRMCKANHLDFATFMREAKKHGIDYKEIRLFCRPDGRPITAEDVAEARGMEQVAAQKFIGKGYYKFREIQRRLGYDVPFNHLVTEVEVLTETTDVYDIEVEETHNFIASEVCVHNSASQPSGQNVTRDDENDEWSAEFSTRRGFIVAPSSACPHHSHGTCAYKTCWKGMIWRVVIFIDLKQIEPRWMAHLARDKNLIAVYERDGDVYSEIGKVAFSMDKDLDDKAWKKAHPDERQASKSIVMAITFGAGPNRVATMVTDAMQAMGRKDYRCTREGGQVIIDRVYDRFQNLELYPQYLKDKYEEQGFVRSPFGRRFYLPNAEQTYMLYSHMIQGSAADLLKQSTVAAYKALRGLDARIIFTEHDKLILDSAWYCAEEAARRTADAMTAHPMRVPLDVDVEVVAKNWAEKKKVTRTGGWDWKTIFQEESNDAG